MSELEMTAFEQRLEQRLRNHSAVLVRPFDAAEIARSAVPTSQRGARWHWSLPAFGRSYMLVILLTLIALTVAVYVGARLLLEQTPPRPYDEVLTRAGQMSISRISPIAVALDDGRVLIAGGQDGSRGAILAEIFDPVSRTSEAVSGSSPVGVGSGILLDDGRALAIAFSQNMTSSFAHVFDPETMAFRLLEQEGYSNAPPFGVTPTMALLNDGRVLFVGGRADVYRQDALDTALLFDPATEQFTPTGSMAVPRIGNAAVPMRDGRVLVVGGLNRILGPPEIYDPTTGAFTSTTPLEEPRVAMDGLLLPDGRVLVYSVEPPPGLGEEVSTADTPGDWAIYDPWPADWTVGVIEHGIPSNASLLRDGRVLFTGDSFVPFTYVGPGEYWDSYEPWAAVLDPTTGVLTETAPTNTVDPGSAVLSDGIVLFAGGLEYPEPDVNGNVSGDGVVSEGIDLYE